MADPYDNHVSTIWFVIHFRRWFSICPIHIHALLIKGSNTQTQNGEGSARSRIDYYNSAMANNEVNTLEIRTADIELKVNVVLR